MLDPTGPFMYQSDATGTSVQAFQTDPLTGYFTAVAGTTISAPGVNGFYVFSIVPGQQNLVGPQASLTPAALSFGNITVGTVSPAQPIALTSTGDQALSLTSISIGGANANEFSETDNCQAPAVLQPSKACAILVTFTPANHRIEAGGADDRGQRAGRTASGATQRHGRHAGTARAGGDDCARIAFLSYD
jgi:hypothetical protein